MPSYVWIFAILTLACATGKGAGAKSVSSVNKVLRAWSQEMQANGGTITHTQAVYREEEVVRRVNQGVWPVEAYHEYQLMAAGSGNVDSARLLRAYALDPLMSRFIDDSSPYPLHRYAARCSTLLLEELLSEQSEHVDSADENQVTALMVASYYDCTDALLVLIAEGADVELVARHGMNAIMIAASRGHAESITALASRGGADVNARHRFAGTTALHMAAELNQTTSIHTLCKLGADPKLATSLGSNALHVAAASNAILSVSPLVSACRIDPNGLMNNDTTALYLAALNGFAKFANELLNHGANVSYCMPAAAHQGSRQLSSNRPGEAGMPLNSEPANGAEAIHAAAENGHLDAVKTLLKHGADINTVSIGVSPVHIAVQYNRVDVVKYLLRKGAQVDKPSSIDGTTPLYYATGAGNELMVNILLKANASALCVNELDSFPFLLAVITGRASIVKRMLQIPGLDTDFSSRSGKTAMQVACSAGDVKIVDMLLRKGSSIHLASGASGDNALLAAARHGRDDVAETIIKYAWSKLTEEDVHRFVQTRNSLDGCSALHYSVQREKKTKRALRLVSLLLDNGADVNGKITKGGVSGATPIYIAASRGDSEVIRLLLGRGSDPNIPLDETAGGYTPLLAAVDRGHVGAVKELLDLGEVPPASRADPNRGVGSAWAQSPVLFAVIKGNAAIVRHLLAAGGDCSVRVAVGDAKDPAAEPASESLLELARRRRDYDVLQVLSSHKSCLTDGAENVDSDVADDREL